MCGSGLGKATRYKLNILRLTFFNVHSVMSISLIEKIEKPLLSIGQSLCLTHFMSCSCFTQTTTHTYMTMYIQIWLSNGTS